MEPAHLFAHTVCPRVISLVVPRCLQGRKSAAVHTGHPRTQHTHAHTHTHTHIVCLHVHLSGAALFARAHERATKEMARGQIAQGPAHLFARSLPACASLWRRAVCKGARARNQRDGSWGRLRRGRLISLDPRGRAAGQPAAGAGVPAQAGPAARRCGCQHNASLRAERADWVGLLKYAG